MTNKINLCTVICLFLMLSGCSMSPVFFTLDSKIPPNQYLEQGVTIDNLNGMIRLVSTQEHSVVTLFAPTIASSKIVDPTITVIAQNKGDESVFFGPSNIASIQLGEIFPAYTFSKWTSVLQRRKTNAAWGTFAGVVGAVIVLDKLLDNQSSSRTSHRHRGSVLLDFPVNSWYFSSYGHSSVNFNYWAFDPYWFNSWHGPTGHLYYLNHHNYYNNYQLESVAYASGNYLQQQTISKDQLASGTIVFPFNSKSSYSTTVMQVRVGNDVHEFNLALNHVRGR